MTYVPRSPYDIIKARPKRYGTDELGPERRLIYLDGQWYDLEHLKRQPATVIEDQVVVYSVLLYPERAVQLTTEEIYTHCPHCHVSFPTNIPAATCPTCQHCPDCGGRKIYTDADFPPGWKPEGPDHVPPGFCGGLHGPRGPEGPAGEP